MESAQLCGTCGSDSGDLLFLAKGILCSRAANRRKLTQIGVHTHEKSSGFKDHRQYGNHCFPNGLSGISVNHVRAH
jgi:hypothetical protein